MAPLSKTSRYVVVYLSCAMCAIMLFFTFQSPSLHCAKLALVVIRNTSEVCCSHDSTAPAQVLSKELVIRRVYFDPRWRDGYCNSTVFLVEAKGTTLNSQQFSGCQVGPHFVDKFRFRIPASYSWVRKYKHATSTLALIDCYNIPDVAYGDSASLYYTTFSGVKVEIQAQKPLFIPEPRAALTPSTVRAVVCVGMIRAGAQSPSEHGMLYHWLLYQKVIGVDHVHMIVEENFVRAGGLDNEVIQQALVEGYLSTDYWPNWLNLTEVYNSQKLAYQDCLYRFQGVYDYIIYADSDDFFVPVKKNKSIKHYLLRWCSGSAGTCRFVWRQFFPDCGWDPNSIGADGNFTAAMTYKRIMQRSQFKCGHQLKALLDAGTHAANSLMGGYYQAYVPKDEAYFAHLRFGWPPKGGC